ncbi:CHRD domain-containing protein [Acetobacteraceae bacterium KSS12]|uniref:CHRD domain-containing protein n=2 Tax=Rhizosaccharibacter radicis TaxID=2782605 RepID=A0ABT1W165_9PROT|nr:CHRD domain-containing protein [Acetobacteraceae bacterium KSS12]
MTGQGALAAGTAKDFDVHGSFAGEHGATSHPTGEVTGHYDARTDALSYKITFDGLSGPVSAAHFHGPAGPGKDAGVLKPIDGPYDSPLSGKVTLSAAQAKALRRGEVYVNLHTAAHPNGEARAQLDATP